MSENNTLKTVPEKTEADTITITIDKKKLKKYAIRVGAVTGVVALAALLINASSDEEIVVVPTDYSDDSDENTSDDE